MRWILLVIAVLLPMIASVKGFSGPGQDISISDEIVQAAMSEAFARLDELEQELDEQWLDDSDVSPSAAQMPLLDFAMRASEIWSDTYEMIVGGSPTPSSYIMLLQPVAVRLQALYRQHLSALRNYYGLRYEKVLQQSKNKKDADGWSESVSQLLDGFRGAAQHATPKTIVSEDGDDIGTGDKCLEMLLENTDFGYVMELQGLITDMMEATQSRKEELSIFDDDDLDEDIEVEKPLTKWQARRKRWVKVAVSRTIMFAINYVQGWLAYQGIKRAAVERDRSLPKFPLF